MLCMKSITDTKNVIYYDDTERRLNSVFNIHAQYSTDLIK